MDSGKTQYASKFCVGLELQEIPAGGWVQPHFPGFGRLCINSRVALKIAFPPMTRADAIRYRALVYPGLSHGSFGAHTG